MKLYLSSYKLGNDTDGFKKLVNNMNARVAIIDNARDFSADTARKALSLENDMNNIKSLGFQPEHIDLRDFFDDGSNLANTLSQFDAVWIVGGNSFILRKAMQQSGFDVVIEQLIKTGKLVYAGYSAALCVISPTLDGTQLVDDAYATADGYKDDIIWNGYGLVDFYPIVHYKSDHPESASVDIELEYIKSKNRKYRTLRDGETIIVNTPS